MLSLFLRCLLSFLWLCFDNENDDKCCTNGVYQISDGVFLTPFEFFFSYRKKKKSIKS